MKQFILKHTLALTGLFSTLVLALLLMSFQDSQLIQRDYDLQQTDTDTVPEREQNDHMKMKDFDKLMNELDSRVITQVGEALKNIDFDRISKDVEHSLKSIDMDKIMKDVELSIKNIDMDKILADVKSSLKDVDWDKHSSEINQALKEAREELEKTKIEIKDIDMKEISKELEKAKMEIEKSKIEFKKLDIDKIMNEAKEGIAEAREELKQTKAMFNEMEKDGLISQKEGFSIEFKDTDLYINGKKQPENVADKYRKYTKERNFKIRIDKE